jgi:mannose-6-phosphate isomerase-like protein (cupin superfamily)
MKRIEKPWGYEEILEVNDKYVVKRLFMKAGNRCSLQYHEQKRETILVISGTLLFTTNFEGSDSTWEDIVLNPGDCHTIVPGRTHRMEGITDVIYLETSTPELDDVVRVKDDYGRK